MKLFLTLFACILILNSCDSGSVSVPKPKTYFRIDFPETRQYKTYNNAGCAYQFDIPSYAFIDTNVRKKQDNCWCNIIFPKYNADVHISYKNIKGDLKNYLEDAHKMAYLHTIKANDIEEFSIKDDSAKVYGQLYDITGNTASSIQFYLTDSSQHFVRGALYFNSRPNRDSLDPVINFLKMDIDNLIQTFKWK